MVEGVREPDPVFEAINDVRITVTEIKGVISSVPRLRNDLDEVRLRQAEQRGAINLLKFLFPTTIAAVAAGIAFVGLLIGTPHA